MLPVRPVCAERELGFLVDDAGPVVTGATPGRHCLNTTWCDNGLVSSTSEKGPTMSNTRAAVGAAALILLSTLVPAGPATAAPTTDQSGTTGPSKEIKACLAPIAVPPRSPDVLQGWIDGCRARGLLRQAALLGNHV
jgi:hypothetical protein